MFGDQVQSRDEHPAGQQNRIAYYIIASPYYGREDQAPDESVARAVHLSLGTNANVFRAKADFKFPDRMVPVQYDD